MQSASGVDLDIDPQESFKMGYIYLEGRVEYTCYNPRIKQDTWFEIYWSVKVQRNSIMKSDTDTDKAMLSPAKLRSTGRIYHVRKSVD